MQPIPNDQVDLEIVSDGKLPSVKICTDFSPKLPRKRIFNFDVVNNFFKLLKTSITNFIEAQKNNHTPKWKSCMDYWLKLPILIFLSIVCTVRQKDRRFWVLGDDSFRVMLTFIALGLLVTLTNNKLLILLYRWLCFGAGSLCVLGSLAASQVSIWNHVYEMGPFSPGEIWSGYLTWWYLFDTCFLQFGSMIFNVMIMAVILGTDKWAKNQEEQEETFVDDNYFTRNLGKHSQFVFNCLLISLFLTCASGFSSAVINFIQPSIMRRAFEVLGCVLVVGRVIWITIFLGISITGLHKFYCHFVPDDAFARDGGSLLIEKTETEKKSSNIDQAV